MNYTVRQNCRICSNARQTVELTHQILSLGSTPLADRFVTDPKEVESIFPLNVYICDRCKLVQLVDIVDNDLLFGDDYAFYTGASPSSIAYFAAYAEEMMTRFPEQSRCVLEIASNDGTLLKHFQRGDATVLGVDPAQNVVDEANRNGVPTIAEPFSFQTSREIKAKHDQFGLILANNVLAHVDNLYDFIAGVENVLSDEGICVFEVQYLPKLLFQTAFDHVYHEHRSFFSFAPLVTLFELWKLQIFDVKLADTQGGSIRVYVQRQNREHSEEVTQNVANLQSYEHRLKINELDTYKGFQARVDYSCQELVRILSDLKAQGKTVYGFGASAKGNTLLNYCGIGSDLLECVVDLTPYKIGKYTPGSHIPVKSPDQLNKQPDYYLLLVWNYLPGILEREKAFRDAGGKFIVPIPTPLII